MSRGYFGIGIWNPDKQVNIGTLFRSALCFNADFIFTIGRKYYHQSSDTVKSPRHLPCYQYWNFDDLLTHLPQNAKLVGIETEKHTHTLGNNYVHPEQAVYILGSEGCTLPDYVLSRCYNILKIDTSHCLNVATAGSIVLYDRTSKLK